MLYFNNYNLLLYTDSCTTSLDVISETFAHPETEKYSKNGVKHKTAICTEK